VYDAEMMVQDKLVIETENAVDKRSKALRVPAT
jgi:hypothetical protein